ncbi:MAG: spore protease YyaC [Caldicoprobacterales bacterium]
MDKRSFAYIDIKEPYAVSKFSKRFEEVFLETIDTCSDIIVLCVGTDRSTGDCLGPLVGQKLETIQNESIHVYGTLDEPVHAKNLKDTIQEIENKYENPFIIGIDACLGKTESVGCITVEKGPVIPGAGVNKNLPPVGDIHVMGIVNVGGFMEYIILQNTRLSLVMKMAEIISAGMRYNLLRLAIDKQKKVVSVKE